MSNTEKIGNVTLNYDFYPGEDTYSDGDIENRLLEIVQTKNEEEIAEFLTQSDVWAYLYHLSAIRHNLVEWIDFGEHASVLEIGAGCGAITGALCRKADRVVGIDLSKRRSTINATRNKNYSNLELVVGNFEDIKLEEKFDVVTLIGVLEYSIFYINSGHPFEDMLKKAKEYLKPGGMLIVAIENKYGLKYFAGAKEDHTGNMFDGIEGYHGVDRVRTFSRPALEKLLESAGFTENAFYYPVPDYKMPMTVYSDEYLPKKGDISEMSPAYDRVRMELFDEAKAYDDICDDGLFPIFANSFLTISR